MKKYTIWSIATITGTALLALLYLQGLYFREVVDICSEQFDLQSQRSMRKVARETDETLRLLGDYEELTVDERVNGADLDRRLHKTLSDNGIDVGYHFRVVTADGRELYRCADFQEPGRLKVYSQELFVHSPKAQMAVINMHFPDRSKYILESVHYMVPVVLLILLVLLMFILTVWATFRQKRLSEIKNDFINNMTHELKTPISSISLAAQMLSDSSMPKTEQMVKHLSTVISDETRRLRFLVDKVLQMSMFDRQKAATFKMRELDVNALVSDVISTFRLKVEKNGGTLSSELKAPEAIVMADEMHLTNVVFNLLDNAVKYRNPDRDLTLKVTTRQEGVNLVVTVEDNGIGIRHEDLRKVFERFYRVSTGNRHDVKGFGLGLAYVHSVISGHKGHIHAESEFGKGTRFVIELPLLTPTNNNK